jgi:hypothetical protein
MPKWKEFTNPREVRDYFRPVFNQVRSGTLDLGRPHYVLSLAYGVMQAIHCGYDEITAIEFGVGRGGGLLDLCKAAQFFTDELGLKISVLGFDNATGLPPPVDYRDHPEIWQRGQYKLPNAEQLSLDLPPFARLVVGDIQETIADLPKLMSAPLGFVSVDVDYYSSATACLKAFSFDPSLYVPAVPVYFDEVDTLFTLSDRGGERLAITEFNEQHRLRSIEPKPECRIRQFYACHVLDHPVRTGTQPPIPFYIVPI